MTTPDLTGPEFSAPWSKFEVCLRSGLSTLSSDVNQSDYSNGAQEAAHWVVDRIGIRFGKESEATNPREQKETRKQIRAFHSAFPYVEGAVVSQQCSPRDSFVTGNPES
jgi:hypothetical protein